MSTLSDLRRFIQRQALLPDGARILVGVSGGPDSLALLHALRALGPACGWHLHAAYLHHGLRPEAEAEARFVAEAASAWGLGCTIAGADVGAVAAQPGVSVEEAARQLRYAFLAETATRLGAGFVAVGHHADDQAETVLMHLLRGSGLAGLRGMLPSVPLSSLRLNALPPERRPDAGQVRLVRPWLETPRAEIMAYCRANALEPLFDASNDDLGLFRNRLRHQALPLLRQFNPNLTAVLARTAAALQGDFEALDEQRRGLWQQLAQVQPGSVAFDLAAFRRLARGDQRALLRRAIAVLQPDWRDINWAHSEGLLDVLAAAAGAASGGPYPLVGGLAAWLHYTRLEIAAEPDTAAFPQVGEPIVLPLPGQAALAGGWQLTARRVEWPPEGAPPWSGAPDANTLWLPADLSGPLLVRSRRPGDRLQILAAGGSKAIPDLMTELKLPRAVRPQWPLVVADGGEVLWLAGVRAGLGSRVSAAAGAAWEVRLAAHSGLAV